MKIKIKHEKKDRKMSAFTRRYLLQYLLTLLIPVAAVSAIAFLADWLAGFRIWYSNELLYQVLHAIKEDIFTFILLTVVIVGTVTTVIFIRMPLKYIENVIDAAKELTVPTDKPIELPSSLAEMQYELNSVRETALRNAAIAREAEQRKNDMIVYLAHDLKTPLTSVIGYLSLLRDEPNISEETRAKYTDIALDRSQRLEELINEFFDITRFSLSTLSFEAQRIDLSLMLNQTVSEFAPILSEHSLTLKSEVQPGVDLLCDPDKLERVFDNLLRNAVSYSYPNTEIMLSMTADDSTVTVTCLNHGRTIPADKLDRIFEQFFRADSARQSKTGGAGLGLAIAKEIVTLHGGTITALSENETVTFTVTLPMIF